MRNMLKTMLLKIPSCSLGDWLNDMLAMQLVHFHLTLSWPKRLTYIPAKAPHMYSAETTSDLTGLEEARTGEAAAVVLHAQDCNGETPLHLAVKQALGNVPDEVTPTEPLIEEVDVEAMDRLDSCLCHTSTHLIHGFAVSELLCAQRMHNSDGFMPIHIAAARGNVPVCEALLKNGAPINARTLRRDPLVRHGFCRPPRWGKRNNDGDLVEITMADKTSLHLAVHLLRGQHEVNEEDELDTTLVRLLLSHGADVNAVDFNGETPFHIAILGNMHTVVSLLAEAGADLTVGCKSFGRKNTAIHLAVLRNDVRMVELLTGHGASVDAIGRDGWTPLCLAARQGSPDVAKALIAAGCNVFLPAGNGKTPLDIATMNVQHKKRGVLDVLQREVAAAVLQIAYSRT